MLNSLIEIITLSLKNHIQVGIKGFGTFDIRVREIREDNFHSDSSISMRMWVPVFKPSKDFKDMVNNEISDFAKSETIQVKTREQTSSFDASLNTQSKLGALGYNLRISRDERWIILKEKAIPRFGIDQVRNHISWLVRLKRKDRHRDYSSAVFEWEYDLERLNLL